MTEFLYVLFVFFFELYGATIFTNLNDIAIFGIFEEVLILLLWFYWFIKGTSFLSLRFRLLNNLDRTFMNFFLSILTFYLCLTDTWLRSGCFLDHLFTKYLLVKLLVIIDWVSYVFYLVVFELFYYIVDVITDLLINY